MKEIKLAVLDTVTLILKSNMYARKKGRKDKKLTKKKQVERNEAEGFFNEKSKYRSLNWNETKLK